MTDSFPRRGEIYWVNLDPTVGSETAKRRPALVISNDLGNQFSPRVIVAPITSQGVGRVYPFQVGLEAGEGGLPKAGKALLEQIRTLDKSRIGDRVGALPAELRDEVDVAIRRSLSL